MNIAGLVVVLLLAIGLLQVLIWVPLLLWLRRRSQRQSAELTAELGRDQLSRAPEQASYRGGTGGFPAVKGNCLVALTSDRLVWQMLMGQRLEISLPDITGVREEKAFRGAVRAGKTHLVVTAGAAEAGFFVADNAAWLTALKATPAA